MKPQIFFGKRKEAFGRRTSARRRTDLEEKPLPGKKDIGTVNANE